MTLPTNNQTEPQHSLDEQSVFLAARAILNTGEQEAFVRQSCGDDRRRFRQIMAMLQVDAEDPDFLKTPVATSEITALYFREGPQQGDAVGPYTLIEPLGTGGMGIVWMAEQSVPIRRRVALKIMNTGFGTESDLQQFDSERQLLATLDHSGIVKLLDAGNTSDGRPWFAMEFVTGQKITDYCRQKQLSLRERVSLFLGVCESVEHAHHRRVVHRDMKPANILISETQGRPVSKLIDFGVSFPLMSLYEDERSSPVRKQVVQGTPTYMSPEQAAFNSEPTDHRTDIYSLGALLYEIVAGVPPYSSPTWDSSDVVERLRLIRETSPPVLSERLRSQPYEDHMPKDGSSVTRHMLTSLQNRVILQDLNQIVSAACARDPGNRYQSVQWLADDLRRCLEHRPLLTADEYRDPRAKSSKRNDVSVSNNVPLMDANSRVADSVFKFALRHFQTFALTSGLVLCVVVAAVFGARLFSPGMNDGSRVASEIGAFTADRATPLGDATQSAGKVHTSAGPRANTDNEEKEYVDLIREAHFLMQQGQIEETRSVLQKVAELRHFGRTTQTQSLPFEALYLLELCESESKSFPVHAGKVFDVRFSPDGSRIISCGGTDSEYRTKVQDAETGLVLTSFFNGANACCFRESDGALFTADDRGWVSAWDLSQAEPSELFRLEGFELPVGRVWVASNEELLLVTEIEWQSLRCRTSVWNLPSKSLVTTLDGYRVLGFDKSANHMTTSSDNGNIGVWTIPDLQQVQSYDAGITGVTCGEVADSGHIAAGNRHGSIWLWNGSGKGHVLRAEGTPLTGVRDTSFTTDGSLLIAAYNDGTLRIWDVRSATLIRVIESGAAEAWCLDVAPNGESFAAGLSDGTVCVYDLKQMATGFQRYLERPFSLYAGSFSSDGKTAIIPGVKPNQAELIRVRDSSVIRAVNAVFEDPVEKIKHCLMTESINEVILASDQGRIYVAMSGESEAKLRMDSGLGSVLDRPEVSKDGAWLSCSQSLRFEGDPLPPGRIWNLNTGRPVFDLPRIAEEPEFHPHRIASFSIGTTERMLSFEGKTAAVWPAGYLDRSTLPEPEQTLSLPRWLNVADLDGRGMILISTEDDALFLWDSTQKSQKPRLLSHRMPLQSVAVSPDGRTLATGARNGELMLWSLPSCEPLFRLPCAAGAIHQLRFTADGANLNAIIEPPDKTGEILRWGLGM